MKKENIIRTLVGVSLTMSFSGIYYAIWLLTQGHFTTGLWLGLVCCLVITVTFIASVGTLGDNAVCIGLIRNHALRRFLLLVSAIPLAIVVIVITAGDGLWKMVLALIHTLLGSMAWLAVFNAAWNETWKDHATVPARKRPLQNQP